MAYVTIRDVAREARVSVTAVSQILHDKGRFSKETRALVKRTAEDLGYVPDRRASSMRSKESKTVGLLVPDLRNPYFADLVSSMEDELYRRGLTTLIGTSSEQVKRQDAFLETLLGQRIDGAIVVPQGGDSRGIESLIDRGLPLVFVDRRVSGVDSVPSVVSDPYPGMRESMMALMQLGHRRFGYVAHPSLGSFSVNERETAFRSLTAELDIESGEAVVVRCGETHQSRVDALDALLESRATAIICGYSPDAIALIGLLGERGVVIGKEMSVISFDDISVFRLMTPTVAVISQQAEEMGHRGVDILLKLIDGEAEVAVDAHYVPTTFIPRGSIGPVR